MSVTESTINSLDSTLSPNRNLTTLLPIGNVSGKVIYGEHFSTDSLSSLRDLLTNTACVKPVPSQISSATAQIIKIARSQLILIHDLIDQSLFSVSGVTSDLKTIISTKLKSTNESWIYFNRQEWKLFQQTFNFINENVTTTEIANNVTSLIYKALDSKFQVLPSTDQALRNATLLNKSITGIWKGTDSINDGMKFVESVYGNIDLDESLKTTFSNSLMHIGSNGTSSTPLLFRDNDAVNGDRNINYSSNTFDEAKWISVYNEGLNAYSEVTLNAPLSQFPALVGLMSLSLNEDGDVVKSPDPPVTLSNFFNPSDNLIQQPWIMLAASTDSDVSAKITTSVVITSTYSAITAFGSDLTADDAEKMTFTSPVNNTTYAYSDLKDLASYLVHLDECWTHAVVTNNPLVMVLYRLGLAKAPNLPATCLLSAEQSEYVVMEGIGELANFAYSKWDLTGVKSKLTYQQVYYFLITKFYWNLYPKLLTFGLAALRERDLSVPELRRSIEKMVNATNAVEAHFMTLAS